MPERWGRDKV